MLMVQPGESRTSGISLGSGTRITLTPGDCDAIREDCSAVKDAAPNVYARVQLVYGNKNWQPNQIYGTTPGYLEIGNWQISQGDNFTDQDVQSANLVCLVGQTLANDLFRWRQPCWQGASRSQCEHESDWRAGP